MNEAYARQRVVASGETLLVRKKKKKKVFNNVEVLRLRPAERSNASEKSGSRNGMGRNLKLKVA